MANSQSTDIKRILKMYQQSEQKSGVKKISNIPRQNKNRQIKNIQSNNTKIADTQSN